MDDNARPCIITPVDCVVDNAYHFCGFIDMYENDTLEGRWRQVKHKGNSELQIAIERSAFYLGATQCYHMIYEQGISPHIVLEELEAFIAEPAVEYERDKSMDHIFVGFAIITIINALVFIGTVFI